MKRFNLFNIFPGKGTIFTLPMIMCALHSGNCAAQPQFYISLEPNLMLANRRIISDDKSKEYLSARNTAGLGLNFDYRVRLGRRYDLTVAAQFLNLRNSVGIDLAASGFDSINKSNYGMQRYSLSYINAAGIALFAGHSINLTPKSHVRVALGAHIMAGILKPGAVAIVSSTKYYGTANAIAGYKEALLKCGSHLILPGLDLKADYVYQFKNRFLFIGLHYALNPATKIKGTYITFPHFSFSHSGSFGVYVYSGQTGSFLLRAAMHPNSHPQSSF